MQLLVGRSEAITIDNPPGSYARSRNCFNPKSNLAQVDRGFSWEATRHFVVTTDGVVVEVDDAMELRNLDEPEA